MILDKALKRLLETRSERGILDRITAVVILLFFAMILLCYSMYFLYVFETYHNTTSYFPWAWDEGLTSPAPVVTLAAVGIALSAVVCWLSIGSVIYLRSELRELRGKQSSSPSTIGRRRSYVSAILFVCGLILILAGVDIGFMSDIWRHGPQISVSGGETALLVWGSIVFGFISLTIAIAWKMFEV